MSTTAITLLVVAFFIGQVVAIAILVRFMRRREVLLRAHSAAAGWHYESHRAEGRKHREISSARAGWVLRISEPAGGKARKGGAATAAGLTRWRAPALALAQGGAALALPGPGESEARAARLRALLSAAGTSPAGLKPRPAAAGAGLLLASAGAERALRPVVRHPSLASLPPALRDGAELVVLRDRQGLSVLIERALVSPEEIDAIVALGSELAAALTAAKA